MGLGVDAVDVARMRRVLERRPGLVDRLFTADEREYAREHGDPVTRLAVRYAAKEATMKALGVGLGAFRFHDVEVIKARSGEPALSLGGRASELAAARGINGWKVSITHSDLVALAVVVGLG